MKSIILILSSLLSTLLYAGELADFRLYQPQSLWLGFNTYDTNEKFVFCQITSNGAHNPFAIKEKVFFDEGSSTIKKKEQKKITELFSTHGDNVKAIRLSAYADQCGNEQDNLELSRERAENVLKKLTELTQEKPQITGSYSGESKSRKHSEHDRYVEIDIQLNKANLKIENLYLIDGSGSFSDRRSLRGFSFQQIKKLHFTPGTMVYVVRDSFVGCLTTNLADYQPDGGTFVKQAQGVIASQVRGHLNVITYTDEKEIFTQEESRIFSEIMRKTRAAGNRIRWFYR